MKRAAALFYGVLGVTLAASVLTGSAQVVVSSSDPFLLLSTPIPRGTGLIAGRVVDGTSGAAIVGATVYTSLGVPQNVSYEPVLTDQQGRFPLRDMPKVKTSRSLANSLNVKTMKG